MHSKKSKQTHSLKPPQYSSITFEAIGTNWEIDIPLLHEDENSEIAQKIVKRIATFDKNYSRFREDSLVYSLYTNPGTYPLPHDAYPMLQLYEKLYHVSSGHFTPLIGTLLSQAGYDKDYSFVQKAIQAMPKLEDVMSYSYKTITLKESQLLDFGAAGKGYLVDIIGRLLEREGLQTYCINASGDILYKAAKPLKVGLEHPENPKQVIGVTTIQDESICASATNRRKWHNFHHIVDPHTAVSPSTIRATWVKADTTILADALATCLFFTNPKVLQKDFVFDYLILYQDYTIDSSNHFNAELYYN